MFKHLPPSGSPIKTLEILKWLKCAVLQIDKRQELSNAINKKFHVDHSYLLSTGRGAMVLLLESLKDICNDKHRNEVVVPAYTCYSVASSIIKAGLKIRICDVNPETLSYSEPQLEQIPYENVLCIITSNLYGLPNHLSHIQDVADKNEVYLIDDSAQSINSKSNGKYVGTFGTAGIYSLDKGKNITSIDGGIIVTNNLRLSEAIQKRYESLLPPTLGDNLKIAIKILVYYFMLNPYVYWLPASLPFLKLGMTVYDDTYPIRLYPRMIAPIALSQLLRIDSITDLRVENGRWYENNLTVNSILKKIVVLDNSEPVYLRYPIKILDKDMRNRLLTELKKYGVTISYPDSLDNLEEIEDFIVDKTQCNSAAQVSKELITIPTHMFVSEEDRANLCKVINELCI